MEDKDARNTKYLTENGRQGYKKYKIPERAWRTWIQQIQNIKQKMEDKDTRNTKYLREIEDKDTRNTRENGGRG